MEIELGQKAPDFTLSDQDDNSHMLSDYYGKWVLLYFYPKDDTPGCTKEAISLRDHCHEFTERNISIFGVSTDTTKSHKKFVRKYSIPFPLLSDVDKEVVRLYGVWVERKIFGQEYSGTLRQSFLVNPDGKVVMIYKSVTPATHAEEVLSDHKKLTS